MLLGLQVPERAADNSAIREQGDPVAAVEPIDDVEDRGVVRPDDERFDQQASLLLDLADRSVPDQLAVLDVASREREDALPDGGGLAATRGQEPPILHHADNKK